jgi:DNA helicase HerA-like ATPase
LNIAKHNIKRKKNLKYERNLQSTRIYQAIAKFADFRQKENWFSFWCKYFTCIKNTVVGGKQQPLLVVLEEAHNYLKAGENFISSRIIQTIAKEGRKHGVGLLSVT